jgi:hypothetical protein
MGEIRVWGNGGMILTGRKSNYLEENPPHSHFDSRITWTEVGSNPDLCSERLATNHVILKKMELHSVHDERYQLDGKTVIYYHKLSLHISGIYMPIFRSTGCMLLHMVFSTVKEN